MTIKSIKEKNKKEFEEKFVLRPFEPDGDWSFDYKNLTPYNLKEFLSVAENRIIAGVVEELNKLPVGHTPDGKNHWVDYKAIQNLKEKLEEEMK